MSGLLDFLSSDDAQLGMNLLAAGGASTDPNMNFGARLTGAVNATRASRDANDDRAIKRTLLNSQIAENEAQAEARRAQIAKQMQIQGLTAGLLGDMNGSGTSMGGGSNLGPVSPQEAAGLRGVPIEKIAALKAAGGPDLIEAWKAVNVPTALAAGSYAYTPGASPTYMADPSKGLGIGPNGVFVLPGAAQAQADLARGTERAKAEENARFQEATPVYDPVTGAKVINTRLNQYGGGGATAVPPAIARPGPSYTSSGAAGGSTNAAAQGQMEILAAELPKAQAAFSAAQASGDAAGAARAQADIAGIQREMARLPGGRPVIGTMPASAGGGRGSISPAMPPAIATAPANVVELSPQQQAANEAAKAALVDKAKGEVVTKQAKQKALNTGNDILRTIDKVLTHPGLDSGTGMSSKVDPRNIVPGTDAYNFSVARKQLQGQTFLQAYEGLRGGGAITETEGAKAENAIARLDNAQSTAEYKAALADLKAVVERGMKLTRGESVPDVPLANAGKQRSVADLLKQYGSK